jgi:hypothetical protein
MTLAACFKLGIVSFKFVHFDPIVGQDGLWDS